MSQQHIDIWNTCAEAFSARYDALTDEQQSAATPCADWTVSDLVGHAVGTQVQFLANMVGANIAEGAGWPEARAAIAEALTNEAALAGTIEMPGMGEVPKMVPLGIAASDLLVHTWDLARAIGADETLPADAVAATYAGLQRFPEQAMRSEGMFGPVVEVAEDADMQTQMLAFAGRTV